MNIEDSKLYNYLIFISSMESDYNVKEVFNLILGYQIASNEEWIGELNDFMEKKLLNKYYGGEFDKLPRNYGDIIYEFQESDSSGLLEFFAILNEFKESLIN